MSPLFAHYVASAERCVFAETSLARRAWKLLRASFPEALAVNLMPDHLHLVAPERTDGARVLGRVVRRVTRPLGRDAARWWAPVPEPERLSSRDKLMRTVRYVWLNPCRPWRHGGRSLRLTEDPLSWTWSTLRDTLGIVLDPWTPAAAVAKAFAWDHDWRLRERIHAYATADEHVAEAARAFPGLAVGAGPTTFALEDILEAALAATREPAGALRRKTRARRIAVGLAYRFGWGRPKQLAGHLDVHPNTVCRIATRARPAEIDVAAQCLDRRLHLRTDLNALKPQR